MKKVKAMCAFLSLFSNFYAFAQQQDCPIDQNGQPVNPSCPYIYDRQQTTVMRNLGDPVRFYIREEYGGELFMPLGAAHNSTHGSSTATSLDYIPLFEDCNLPTSKSDPGWCDVEGSFQPYSLNFSSAQHSQESYLKRELRPLYFKYHYSNQYNPDPLDRDAIDLISHKYEFKDVTEYHLVLDYTHYRLKSKPLHIETERSSVSEGKPGKITLTFDNELIKGCNKQPVVITADPAANYIELKQNEAGDSLIFPSVDYLAVRQWRNSIFYEVATKSALYNDPGFVICRDYLTDDIYKGGFEDEIFTHGFDDMPWRFHPPGGYIPPRP